MKPEIREVVCPNCSTRPARVLWCEQTYTLRTCTTCGLVFRDTPPRGHSAKGSNDIQTYLSSDAEWPVSFARRRGLPAQPGTLDPLFLSPNSFDDQSLNVLLRRNRFVPATWTTTMFPRTYGSAPTDQIKRALYSVANWLTRGDTLNVATRLGWPE